MPDSHTDWNLLFGIVALQMDFVSRDALVTAMNSWAVDKKRSLGEILREQGVLTQSRLELLEQLVREHLKQHDNDACKSLAAAGASGLRPGELARFSDPDIERRLVAMTMQLPTCDFPTSPAAAMPRDGERYRILRPLAKGGLGEVYVALDQELHREVALKQINEAQADNPDSRARFILEAEITGGLEHPSIVPVYTLGYHRDGRPYYAMRFIRGRSLAEAINWFHSPDGPARSSRRIDRVELQKLLQHIIDVCHALEYAHSRGVLHRDLKPDNVMIGKYGETLLVDWGLAKSQDSPAARAERSQPADQGDALPAAEDEPLLSSGSGGSVPTQMGSAIGTPQFMSPEQARGQLDQICARSDVYGLGATLFCLLTGQPPFPKSTVGEVLRKVEHGDFPCPRQLRPGISRGLEAVCLKAMSLVPENRYASVRELRHDLEQWLADEPVTALGENVLQRGARFVRRHVLATTAAFVGCTALGICLTVAIVANERLRSAEQHSSDVDRMNAQLEKLNADVEAARVQAQRNFDEAHVALNDVFGTLTSGELRDKPELQDLRRKLKDYYLAYLRQTKSDPQLQAETASIYERMAAVTRTIGNKREAEDDYRAAQHIYKKLLDAAPQAADLRSQLARNHVAYGQLLNDFGRWDAGRNEFKQAITELSAVVRQVPDNLEYQSQLADAHHNFGILLDDHKQNEAALREYTEGMQIRQAIVDRSREPRYRAALARSYGYRGDVQLELLHTKEAFRAYGEAERIRRQLVDEQPDNWDARFELARSYQNTANVFGRIDVDSPLRAEPPCGGKATVDCALAALDEARELQEDLVGQKPANTECRNDLVWTCNKQAEMLLSKGEVQTAYDPFEEAYNNSRELVRGNEGDVFMMSGLASALVNRARWTAQRKPAELPAALKAAHARLDVLLKARDSDPEDIYQQAVLRALGGDAEGALESLQKSIDAGFTNIGLLERDSGLKSLRSRADFQALLKALQAKD